MRDMQHILKDVLGIIDYKGDKEKFIEEFTTAILQNAFIETIQALPEDSKRELLQGTANNFEPEAFENLLSEHMDVKLYKRKVAKVTNRIFLDYIQTITPTLTLEVRNKLQQYILAQI